MLGIGCCCKCLPEIITGNIRAMDSPDKFMKTISIMDRTGAVIWSGEKDNLPQHFTVARASLDTCCCLTVGGTWSGTLIESDMSNSHSVMIEITNVNADFTQVGTISFGGLQGIADIPQSGQLVGYLNLRNLCPSPPPPLWPEP
jgi:hypothetical protein